MISMTLMPELDRWIAWLDETHGKGASSLPPKSRYSVAAGMTAALTWRILCIQP